MNIRKVFHITWISVLIFSGLLIVFFHDGTGIRDAEGATRATDHMVFVEDATATWCQYCPSASEGLKDLSNSRDDFRFITLVDDMIPEASQRNEELKVSGYPTVYFDGGYEYRSGSVSSGDDYEELIDSCSSREVPNLDVEVLCYDKGGSELYVEVDVTNNDRTSYGGRLLVQVVEVVSRYEDYDGNQYPNSLLGYVIDIDVSIDAGSTYTSSGSWTGSENEDLQGDDFSDIESDNIVIYAALFNSKNNYKIQPSVYVAHYADAVGEAYPEEIGGSPEVEITSPRNGRSVEGDVEIRAEVTSDNDIDVVEIKIGQGSFRDMDQDGGYYVYDWDSTDLGNGLVKITVRATDDQSLSGVDSIEVLIDNEGSATPPEIAWIDHQPAIPEEGETVEVTVDIDVYDAYVTSVELTYCVGDICMAPVDMGSMGGDSYLLEIGPFQGGDEVTYEVLVEDDQGNEIRSPEYTFTVPEAADPDPSDSDDQTTSGGDQSTPAYLLWLGSAAVLFVLVIVRRRK